MNDRFRLNNFDIIRLAAALQVALHHSMSHLRIEADSLLLLELTALFPGVPIFFFVSGFLISRSLENNPRLGEYAQNRVLRIYPALVVCTLLAVASAWASGYFAARPVDPLTFVLWIAGQVSIVQFFNPEFMRAFGTGVLNGSLWSVTVELQFYLILPVIYHVLRLGRSGGNAWALLLLVAAALAIQIARNHVGLDARRALPFKLFNVTFLPWIFMFLIGVLAQRDFDRLHRLLAGRFWWLCLAYVAATLFATKTLGAMLGNEINPLLYLLLAAVVFSAAYTGAGWSHRLLHGNDVSYGMYIYHIPVVNLLMQLGLVGATWHVVLVLLATGVLATLSWWLVERPSLRLKRHPMNPLQPSRTG